MPRFILRSASVVSEAFFISTVRPMTRNVTTGMSKAIMRGTLRNVRDRRDGIRLGRSWCQLSIRNERTVSAGIMVQTMRDDSTPGKTLVIGETSG